MRSFFLLVWLLGLALFARVSADPVPVRFPLNFSWEGMRCRVPNAEITPDKRYVLVHAFLTSPQPVNSVAWQNLFCLVNHQGEIRQASPDCGVDSGNGMQITTGSFPLKADREVQLLIYFAIHEDELPARLQLPDESRTVFVER